MIRFTLLATAFVVVGALGCNGSRCDRICETWDDCGIENVDVSDCANRCEDRVDASQTFDDQVQACSDCIDDPTSSDEGDTICPAAGSTCEDVCNEVVAEST